MDKLLVEHVAEAIFNSQHEERWANEREGIVTAMFRESAKAAIKAIQSYKQSDNILSGILPPCNSESDKLALARTKQSEKK